MYRRVLCGCSDLDPYVCSGVFEGGPYCRFTVLCCKFRIGGPDSGPRKGDEFEGRTPGFVRTRRKVCVTLCLKAHVGSTLTTSLILMEDTLLNFFFFFFFFWSVTILYLFIIRHQKCSTRDLSLSVLLPSRSSGEVVFLKGRYLFTL